jgi:hypothetical protein
MTDDSYNEETQTMLVGNFASNHRGHYLFYEEDSTSKRLKSNEDSNSILPFIRCEDSRFDK